MRHNCILIETRQARECHVARQIGLLGCWAEVPMDVRFKALWRNAKAKATRRIETPVIPRLVFASASYPGHDLIMALPDVARIVRNGQGLPSVIPGWQMDLFLEKVAQRALEAERRALPPSPKKKAKWVKLDGQDVFAALMSYFDAETGEIFEVAA